jgi:hypothetical protein
MPATRKKKITRKRPIVRGPFDAVRHQTKVDPDTGLTRQSFRDECDINKIVDTYARTGMVNHIPKTQPIYGDCPDQGLFEAALIQAEIRSSYEDAALNPPSDALRGSETDDQSEPGTPPAGEPETAAEAAENASEGES